jgi:Domain of unknown function (DUF4331)
MRTLMLLALVGCDSGSMSPPPPVPGVGAQIDRLGRGTINVAVTDPFDITTMGQNATRDAYNADGDEAGWVARWVPDLETMLAIYDGADGTCGNQLLADTSKTDKSRYATLATVLADDRLYLDTSKTTCTTYLGVELDAVGVANSDCGGRTPNEQVVHIMYTAATVGASGFKADGTFAVTDGVPADGDGTTASLTAFPFLTAPN